MRHPAIYTQASFKPDRVPPSRGGKSMRCNSITSDDIRGIIDSIDGVLAYYSDKTLLEKILVTIYYKGVTPKTSRVATLFCEKGKMSFESTVGARYETFYNGKNHSYRHVITHYIPSIVLNISKDLLTKTLNIVENSFDGVFLKQYLSRGDETLKQVIFDRKNITKTDFISTIIDASEIIKVGVLFPENINESTKIINIFPCFDTIPDLNYFLKRIISGTYKILNKTSIILTTDQIKQLRDIAPYIICMGDDFSTYNDSDGDDSSGFETKVPKVDHKLPTIGVFDTYFDERCFFSDYVEVIDLLKNRHNPSELDYCHGSKVDSILVMGHMLNGQALNDNCGFFKVKHFVVGGYKFVDFEVLFEKIEDVVKDNCAYIKVWNMSLGDKKGSDPNYISLLGARIDEISRKYNVLFVVAGTNIDKDFRDERIGSPADSLNALVVNSIGFNKEIPTYARKGPVLTFIPKPDICYYGGTEEKKLICYSPKPNDCMGYGTSFATPYIARKCAYLIHMCNVPVQCAKAMIIDSAYNWGELSNNKPYMGYGVPSVDINDIIGSRRDEIKFIFYGNTKNQHTYISDFPILLEQNSRFNYRTKLSFCYFTFGSRQLGVDYANQDISINFGHIHMYPYRCPDGTIENHLKVDKITSKDVSSSSVDYLGEELSIKKFDKWNNTKILIEKERAKGKEYESNEKWGIMISHLERFGTVSNQQWNEEPGEHSVNFGIVVTFKTIDGTDARYDDFFKLVNDSKNFFLRPLDLSLENIISQQAEGIVKPE